MCNFLNGFFFLFEIFCGCCFIPPPPPSKLQLGKRAIKNESEMEKYLRSIILSIQKRKAWIKSFLACLIRNTSIRLLVGSANIYATINS